jgi:hypothetical protein
VLGEETVRQISEMATPMPNPANLMFLLPPQMGGDPKAYAKGKSPQCEAKGSGGGNDGGGELPVAANTTIVAPTEKPNGGSLRGNPPEVFTSVRSKSDKFLQEFRLYHLTNHRLEVMRSSVKRVALALSYIWGPNVDDWVECAMNNMLAMTTR